MRLLGCLLGAAASAATTLLPLPSLGQAPSDPAQCAAFSAIADKHAEQAQMHMKAIETAAKNMDPGSVASFVEQKSKIASSESEVSGLAREAYRRCLIGYLQGGQAAQPAPVPEPATPPVQQAQPVQQQPVQQLPVQQAQPVKRSPVQQQQVSRQKAQPEQQENRPIFRPGGLIDLGLGFGLGRILRDR